MKKTNPGAITNLNSTALLHFSTVTALDVAKLYLNINK